MTGLREQKCTGNQGTAQNVQIREVFQIGEVSNKRVFTVIRNFVTSMQNYTKILGERESSASYVITSYLSRLAMLSLAILQFLKFINRVSSSKRSFF